MKSYITGRFADFVSFGFQYHFYHILQKILVDTECLEQYCTFVLAAEYFLCDKFQLLDWRQITLHVCYKTTAAHDLITLLLFQTYTLRF